MFELIQREEIVTIHPSLFDNDISQEIEAKIKKKYEGKFCSEYGYVIFVKSVDFIDKGVIQHDTNNADFNVKFTSLTCKVVKNSIIPAIVTMVRLDGICCAAGPYEIYIPRTYIGDDLIYQNTDNQASFKNENVNITIGSPIITAVVGFPKNKTVGLATIKRDYLG